MYSALLKMNRKKVNGSKPNGSSFPKRENDLDSNSTDSFDMNDFKSSSLNQKYSVQVHKNKADLMAELSSINIMGDESDVEMISPRTEQNGLAASASVSDVNSSKMTSLNSSRSTDARSNGDFDSEKQERILAWAQSQSQNLSMCVASILSDHDYLSQQSLLGLVTGNEENTEMEMQSQRKINGDITSNEQNGDAEIMEQQSDRDIGAKTHDNSDNDSASHIEVLSAILKKIADSKEKEQRLNLLTDIEEQIKQMKAHLAPNDSDNKTGDTMQSNTVNQSESNNITPEFSSNHSEPMEHYGNLRFTSDSGTDPVKDTEGKLLL